MNGNNNINLPSIASVKGTTGSYSAPIIPSSINLNASTRSFTGTGPPSCSFCGMLSFNTILQYFNLDFEKQPHGEGIALCIFCANETELRLKKFKRMPLDELPLHLDEPNRFVYHLIKKRFNEEQIPEIISK